MSEIRLMKPGKAGQVINEFGLAETPPKGWDFLPAGDAAVTRKVTAKGACWRVQVQKGKRIQSLGIWAQKEHIEAAIEEVKQMRAAPDYDKRKAIASKARTKKQEKYITDFEQAVKTYLHFDTKYHSLAEKMARLVTDHATPVGSGTVARTKMISIEARAAKAVIAWMRHKTTDYEQMKIARIKGERRKVRRALAEASVKHLSPYRKGHSIPANCPLFGVLASNEGAH